MDPELSFPVPRHLRRGSAKNNEFESVRSGRQILRATRDLCGWETFVGKDILDYGCGVKMTQAILQFDIAVNSYFGLDVYSEMIGFLHRKVDDPRFTFRPVTFMNEMYNPSGEPVDRGSLLPCGDRTFDLITLYSVFTHMEPNDIDALLHVFRRYIRDDGYLLFTAFVDDEMTQAFRDDDPETPLLRAYHRSDALRSMIEGAQWRVASANPPGNRMQHHFLLAPV